MKEIISVSDIGRAILILRGQRVMLDRDLAGLYGVETRALNQAVKRNEDRFPDDFVFALSRAEIKRISQIVTSSSQLKFSKQVRAFTEQGVAMLSSVLNSERSGERTRLACWRWGPRHRELFLLDSIFALDIDLRTFRRGRRKEHARRVCSPIR